ncbi:ectonucleotide pyrophosphatase/phosphodiesterase [Rheinheimera soli]|uniref:alkaline phosphatase family protein n=1 Tax=Rheinheimera soli TaxID=443616 RepID=UPI001E4FBD7D
MRSFFLVLLCLVISLDLHSAQAKSHSQSQDHSLLLISIDGFGQKYWDSYKAPVLHQLAQGGARALSMQPVFPTKTFPNHYSIATGLYPANHGIVENNIYDADFDAVFRMSKPEEVTNGRWWLGEPIWVTAEKQGVKTGTYFFPGSEAAIKGVRPGLWQAYDGSVSNIDRVNSVLAWLDLPVEQRPKFLTLYFSSVDDAGHAYGPESKQVADAIADVDQALGVLVKGLQQRGLQHSINLMLVSDHGMAKVPQDQVMAMDQLFDQKKAALVLWTPEIVSIFPKKAELEAIYQQLKTSLPPQARVYKKSELPERWHYQNSTRIAPLLVVPDTGWRLMQKHRQKEWLEKPGRSAVTGSHGYDNNSPAMQAIFVGYGPAFAAGSQIPAFSNIELYNLMCRILGIQPAPNDGNPDWVHSVYQAEKKKN